MSARAERLSPMPRTSTAALVLGLASFGCAATPRSEVYSLARVYSVPCPPGTSEKETLSQDELHDGHGFLEPGKRRSATLERSCVDSTGEISGQRLRAIATELRPPNAPPHWERRVDAQVFHGAAPSGLRVMLREWQGGALLDYSFVFDDVFHGSRRRYYLVKGAWRSTEVEELDRGIVRAAHTSEGTVTTLATGESIWDMQSAKGRCLHDKRDGRWSLHNPDWPDIERTYEGGIANGRFEIRGQVEGAYVDGLPSGKWRLATLRQKICIRPLPNETHGCVVTSKCGLELPDQSHDERAENVIDWDARPIEERERFREPLARCEVERAVPIFDR